MKYIPLGGFVTIDDEVYKCVLFNVTLDEGCSKCDFSASYHCNQYDCTRHTRRCETEVKFILYDTIPEDEPQQHE